MESGIGEGAKTTIAHLTPDGVLCSHSTQTLLTPDTRADVTRCSRWLHCPSPGSDGQWILRARDGGGSFYPPQYFPHRLILVAPHECLQKAKKKKVSSRKIQVGLLNATEPGTTPRKVVSVSPKFQTYENREPCDLQVLKSCLVSWDWTRLAPWRDAGKAEHHPRRRWHLLH